MKVNDIIVLENQERFTLLEEVEDEGFRYFLAAGIDEEENIDSKKLALLKLVEQPDGAYVELIKNQELMTKLTQKIKDANC
ncbi:MAG: hypothetical protein E7167_05450 [Firmicutes bacterium]|nr:hypothetical protein [Bacillota bacterium]